MCFKCLLTLDMLRLLFLAGYSGALLLSVHAGTLDEARSVDHLPGDGVQLLEAVSNEQLLQEDMELEVDAKGFAGMGVAMKLSAEEFKARAGYLQSIEQQLTALGFQSVDVPGDGSCQFHAVVLAAG